MGTNRSDPADVVDRLTVLTMGRPFIVHLSPSFVFAIFQGNGDQNLELDKPRPAFGRPGVAITVANTD